MSRLLANCPTTTTSSSSGSVTTICDCACEGCCCHILELSMSSGDLTIGIRVQDFKDCLGGVPTSFFRYAYVYFDECPLAGDTMPDLLFDLGTSAVGRSLVIPSGASYDCITVVFCTTGNVTEATRCTFRVT